MSKIEVNKVEPQCGTTLTLGGSGDTVTLGTGASQSGFGRSGSVNWQTTPKTATFTAVDGEGYFINSGSAITCNLPAGSAGAIIAVSDYARNFETYNLTISPNGSEKIGGTAQDATLNVDGQAATFVYVDSTKGWVNVQNAEDTETGQPPFISATGGTITTCGNFKVHTFTGPGTFNVTKVATSPPAPAHNTVSYLVVAGGASGGGTGATGHLGGGGGAGGFREGKNAPICSYTASPLNAPAGLSVSVQGYSIAVGAGGTSPGSGPAPGGCGSVSTFSTITSAGGGGGGSLGSPSITRNGTPGGSGGGGSSQVAGSGGSGNTPPASPPQGNNGGSGTDSPPDLRGGAGGGATAAGGGGSATSNQAAGAAGATTNISLSPVGYSGGGGAGGTLAGGPGAGGAASPCGSGAAGGPGPSPTGVAAAANRGGGGGGAAGNPASPVNALGGNGGSGVVIIRYRYQ